MFPRTALFIVVSLLTSIAALLMFAAVRSQHQSYRLDCERNIVRPYELLFSRMRELAEAGKTEELRKLIVRAQERTGDLSYVCGKVGESTYAEQVGELIQ
jgi:hypothetical protein